MLLLPVFDDSYLPSAMFVAHQLLLTVTCFCLDM